MKSKILTVPRGDRGGIHQLRIGQFRKRARMTSSAAPPLAKQRICNRSAGAQQFREFVIVRNHGGHGIQFRRCAVFLRSGSACLQFRRACLSSSVVPQISVPAQCRLPPP